MKLHSTSLLPILVLVMGLSACHKEQLTPQKPMNETLKRDFAQRFNRANVIEYTDFLSDNTQHVDFTLGDGINGIAVYKQYQWQLTILSYKDWHQLPSPVSTQFAKTPYTHAEFWGISQITRNGISQPYYEIQFVYPYKQHDRMAHTLYMDAYGNQLGINFRFPNPQLGYNKLSEDALDFIKQKYPQAEILIFFNEAGKDKYYIKDHLQVRLVVFTTHTYWTDRLVEKITWEGTETEQPIDTKLPEKVVEQLKVYPDFHYTKVTHVASPNGNAYRLEDDSRIYSFAY